MTKGIIYSDGGARGNPGPAAIGVLVCDEQGNPLREHQEVIGETTNNVAEYTGVIIGLELSKELGLDEVDYFGDSQLTVRQLSGQYRVKTPHIKELYLKAKSREREFKRVSYTQIPRTHDKIRYVDKLVNRALDEAGY